MNTTASSSLNIPSRPTYSCIRCANRKVKCDRQRPCSACVKHNVDCVFNPSQPVRKRHKRVKVQILTDRLKHYETLLQERGIDPSKLPDTPSSKPRSDSSHTVTADPKDSQLQTPSSNESEPNPYTDKPQVINGQVCFRFVENLWTRLVEESHDSENTLEGTNDSSDPEALDDDVSFVLSSRPMSNNRPGHPPSEQIHQLWGVFTDNVDPLTKIVHVPTLRPVIEKAASNITTIPRSFEALIFAIYGAAVNSLKDDECRQRFSEPRNTLLSQYISATEVALSRAEFMGTNSLVILQALVLHLFSVRDIYEPRVVWTLTGVAIRIAQGMGLERDGESLGLPPFETEMRRRVWWQLKLHDFRSAELCGLAKFRDLDLGTESTKWPTNVNDNQLHPGMPSLVAETNTLTDMVFVAFRYEFAHFAAQCIATFRRQGKGSSEWNLDTPDGGKAEVEKACRALEEALETKYLRYCDPSQPLHLLTMLVARYGMNVVRFLTHHPRRWASIEQTPLPERQLVWEVSIKLLEQFNMVQSNPLLRRFAWHGAFYQQWHAFIHILDTLRADPVKADADKTWQLIGDTYKTTPGMILDMKKPIHVAIGNLCLKAYSDREAALQRRNLYRPPTPEFILQLRQQREIAKTKRQARNAKSSRREDFVSSHDIDPSSEAGVTHVSDTLESASLQQSTMSHPPSFAQTGSTVESDPFYLLNGYDDCQVGNLDMELDLMLAQDYNMKDNPTETITWEQWDAWVADSNLMRPLS
ncbi:MAG: hypothetical protein Q9157_000499 [Trypethelium eluteriae]